jgi:hypothetical protein
MRIVGWILRVLACIWFVFGGLRVFLALTGTGALGPGNHLLVGIITLLLSVAAFWASGKLLDRADKAKQAAHENS